MVYIIRDRYVPNQQKETVIEIIPIRQQQVL